MKILWVKAGKLLPVDTGGKIRSYNILRHLAKEHEVTLLSYYGGKRDSDYEVAIAQRLPGARDHLYRCTRGYPGPVSGLHSSAAVYCSVCSAKVHRSPGSSRGREALKRWQPGRCGVRFPLSIPEFS